MAALLSVAGLAHTYGAGSDRVAALRRIDLELEPGERVAVMGRSGSGKTTLLNVLAGLERPSGGRVLIDGHDLARMDRRHREAYRRRVIGYVWQQPHDGLLPGLTVLENVLVPVLGGGEAGPAQVEMALRLLDAIRLGDRLDVLPGRLTAPETQRLAIAVALANDPRLLLADELTARLDWPVARELLGDLAALLGQRAAILVTHDPRVARHVDRLVLIRDGVATPAPVEPGLAAGRRS
ncbi:MAG TPA: ATP-binding cassette domain-containing protein [Candidatus Dormibacteraeota bacterium]|nr:ATP-binding cassette domain-containing protein [Candidatus Dormibacteraeota bacterium]